MPRVAGLPVRSGMMIAMNHLIACVWYGLASMTRGGQPGVVMLQGMGLADRFAVRKIAKQNGRSKPETEPMNQNSPRDLCFLGSQNNPYYYPTDLLLK